LFVVLLLRIVWRARAEDGLWRIGGSRKNSGIGLVCLGGR
jgi:hypothetical protein